jgi:hypothetical protein
LMNDLMNMKILLMIDLENSADGDS